MVDKAAAVPYPPRLISWKIATDMVAVRLVYSIRVDDSSLIMVIQLKMAPDTIPGVIRGIVTWKNVGIDEYPKLCDASSILGLICRRIAELLRTV